MRNHDVADEHSELATNTESGRGVERMGMDAEGTTAGQHEEEEAARAPSEGR